MVGWSTSTVGAAQYHLMGGQLARLSLNLRPDMLPTITLGYEFAYWDQAAFTVPSGTAQSNWNTAPLGGGSVFFQTSGTTTRSVIINGASISLSVDLGLVPMTGLSSSNANYQNITGWIRTKAVPTVSFTQQWSTTYQTLFDTDGSNTTAKQMLVTHSVSNGSSSSGWYCPNLYPVGDRPSVVVDSNGLAAVTATFRGREEQTLTTNELTKSAFRILMG
jgi:hypothetical protein